MITLRKIYFLIDRLYRVSYWKWIQRCRVQYWAALDSLSVILCPHVPLHCNIQRLWQTRLFIHFPHNDSYTDMGITSKQQTAASEDASVKTVLCRNNVRLYSRMFRGVSTDVLLRGDGLVTGLVKRCYEMKAIFWKLFYRWRIAPIKWSREYPK